MQQLPEILQIIAEELGIKEAFKLASTYGGQKVFIPKNIREDSAIVKALGSEIAKVLSENFGGEQIIVPLGGAGTYARMRAKIYADIKSGNFTNNQLAAKYAVSGMTIIRAKHKVRNEEKQDDLFSLTDNE